MKTKRVLEEEVCFFCFFVPGLWERLEASADLEQLAANVFDEMKFHFHLKSNYGDIAQHLYARPGGDFS